MKVEKFENRQAVSRKSGVAAADSDGAAPSEFRAFLERSLGTNPANEEALFASITHDRVTQTGNIDALKKFEARLDKHRRILERNGGYASEEAAAKFALRDLSRNRLITKDEATKIYSVAFSAAQLDDDKEALSDGVGGGTTARLATILDQVDTAVQAMDGGATLVAQRDLGERVTASKLEISVPLRGISSTAFSPEGSAVDGASGFLFKPISDTQHKLVVLAPESLTGNIESLVLKDDKGKIIETGQFSGIGNGERAHFRFNKPGGSYPKNLTVEIRLDGGGVKSYSIPDPNMRYD